MRTRKLDFSIVILIYFFILLLFVVFPKLDSIPIVTSIIRIGAFLALFLYYSYRFLILKDKKISKTAVILIIVYLISQLVTLLFSEGIDGLTKRNLTAIGFPFLSLLLYYVICRDYSLPKRRLIDFCNVLTAFVLIACIYNLVVNFSDLFNLFKVSSSYDLQFMSFFVNRNTFGVVLLIGLFSSVISFFNTQTKRGFLFASIAFITLNLILTFSRASILAAVVFIFVSFVFSKKLSKSFFSKKKTVIALAILIVLVFVIPITRDFIINNVVRLSSGLTHRNEIWKYCIEYFKHHNIIFGNGNTLPYLDYESQFTYIGFHNSYLNTLLCSGIIGLLLYTFVLFISLRYSWKLRKYDDINGNLLFGLIISYIIYCFFEDRSLFGLQYINFIMTFFVVAIPMYLLNAYNNSVKYKFNSKIDFNKDLISIIVPVYNVERYIGKCLESIQKQSYKNIEVIIVDDGSNDNSHDICEKVVKNDNRFKVYKKKNHGASSARNFGLKIAKGKYIYFIDGDDYLDKNTIKVLYDLMITYCCDMSIVGYFFAYDNYVKANENYWGRVELFEKKELLKNIIYRGSYGGYLWNKLYKKEKINNIFFDENMCFREDMVFNSFYIRNIDKGVYYTSPYYYYVQRQGSLLHQKQFDDKMMTHIYSMEKIIDNYKGEAIDCTRVEYEILKCCYNFKYRIYKSKGTYDKSLEKINEINKKYYHDIMNKRTISKITRLELFVTNKFPITICSLKTLFAKVKWYLYE